jgi:3-hydroxyisobutyrate dehydrogenase
MSHETVGFIGLGLMGTPMAGRLLDKGFHLVVYNRSPEKTRALEARGAKPAANPAQVARQAEIVCLMVKDGDAVLALLDEPAGLAEGLGPDQIVINFSTVGIRPAREIGRRISSLQAKYLDAPVLGSTEPAGSGRLILFAGGSEDTAHRAKHVLEALGHKIFPTGEIGSASAVKLVANMLLARYTEALGEVLALCRGFSIEPKLMLEIIQASALASPMWEKGHALLQGPPPLHFPLKHMVKDLGLLDEEIDRLGLSLPAEEAVYGSFLEALQTGLGERDYSEIAGHLLGRSPA